MNLENHFFHFYFSNNDFLFSINSSCITLFLVMQHIYMQESESQNFDLGFCYFFMM